MYHPLLTDARFHNSLFDLDRLIAEQVRQEQCPLFGLWTVVGYIN